MVLEALKKIFFKVILKIECNVLFIMIISIDTKSDFSNINIGIPQGSILSPLLFNVFLNDLHIVFNSSIPILFADDTNLILKIKMLILLN